MFIRKKAGISKTKYVSPGVYTAKVLSIGFDDEYEGNGAIKVEYLLTDENGSVFSFSEYFYNVDGNERTDAFFNHLGEIGIDEEEFERYQGCTEIVTIKKIVKTYSAKPGIVSREFVSFPDEVDTDEVATA